jgi:hypothetical protein
MKKTSTILAIGSALALGSAQAEIESSFHVGYSTDYVFRGINQGELAGSNKDGLYEYGIDFTGDCNCGATWNAGIWQADYGTNSEELDIYTSVAKEFGAIELSLGIIRYEFGTGGGDTTELVIGAGTEIAGLSVGASVYYDVDAFDGLSWVELSAGKSFDVGGDATLDLTANFGSTLQSGGSYTTYGLSAAISKELGDDLTGSIYISAEESTGSGADGDDLFGGLSLSYGF